MQTDATLKAVLSSTGASVYALKRPPTSPLPTLVYRRVTETDYVTHGGATNLSRNRFTIIHVADSYSNLRTLVDDVKTKLLGNKTDFEASVATDVHFEDKEGDTVFTAHKDYYIFFK